MRTRFARLASCLVATTLGAGCGGGPGGQPDSSGTWERPGTTIEGTTTACTGAIMPAALRSVAALCLGAPGFQATQAGSDLTVAPLSVACDGETVTGSGSVTSGIGGACAISPPPTVTSTITP